MENVIMDFLRARGFSVNKNGGICEGITCNIMQTCKRLFYFKIENNEVKLIAGEYINSEGWFDYENYELKVIEDRLNLDIKEKVLNC
ncbi:hypothetical protein [Clostridium paraputrificum]|uniref:hypothetical protein n=1 Tax=Clostridium paraputrificum TaxID=29363 RepID=UPI00189DB970|nr:hypothetical protein [Clostridium paraputrificum]